MPSTSHHSGKLDDSPNKIIRGLQQGVRSIGNTVGSAVENAATAAGNYITSFADPIIGEGREAINNIITSVERVAPTAIATATAALAKLQFSGMTGNFQSATENIVLTLTAFNVADDNSVNIGAPYRKVAPLGILGGFCQCENAKVQLTCTETEQRAVEELLNKGVFIE